MGTLFDQRPRVSYTVKNSDLRDEIRSWKKIAAEESITLNQLIAIRAVLESERRNHLFADNGDACDEQIAGIGELLHRLGSEVGHVASMIEGLSLSVCALKK